VSVIALILGLLFGTYIVLTIAGLLPGRLQLSSSLRGRIALSLVFLVTGFSHFFQTEAMTAMLPPSVPGRVAIIYVTGILELAAAVGLLLPGLYRAAGICLILFLLCVLPANIYSAVNRVEMGGHAMGPSYLAVRVPLQIILMAWAWWFAVRRVRPPGSGRS
jgi:uncharacterized membrane protein